MKYVGQWRRAAVAENFNPETHNIMAYSDAEINEFLSLAQEVGITKARRELGYPKSWSTAQYWAKQRGVKCDADEIMQKAAVTREWYKTEEVIIVAQEGFNRVYEELTTNNSLTPDDQKKLSEALMKHYNVWASAQGKATNITETRTGDTMDEHLQELLNMERAKNKLNKMDVTEES